MECKGVRVAAASWMSRAEQRFKVKVYKTAIAAYTAYQLKLQLVACMLVGVSHDDRIPLLGQTGLSQQVSTPVVQALLQGMHAARKVSLQFLSCSIH